ncbi:MAG: 3-dehydro-L-gulonate 2-dehydrogenase [Caldilineaceae bacterium]
MRRIMFADMQQIFQQILESHGFTTDRAETCARIFAESSLDGVSSHGVNRFAGFVDFVRQGYVKVDAEPVLRQSLGALEQWDGQLGPGPLNALFATERAMTLARRHGIGCVGLANTNHWMRGGSYGWAAAEAGFGLIAWTNTKPNMPAYGAADLHLGNNPLVIAVPRAEGHTVLDMAMTQFSLGRIGMAARRDENLPVPGGYDINGNLTHDAAAIEASGRALPVGHWKGAGLALLLDLMAALLSGGQTTVQIGRQETEYGVSQVFIAFDMTKTRTAAELEEMLNDSIDDLHASIPSELGNRIRYPGEGSQQTRQENLQLGIPVDDDIWDEILQLLPH